MSQRAQIIAWFEQLNLAERKAILPLLSESEKARLQSILEPDVASSPSSQLSHRNKLLGAPDIFFHLLNGEDVSGYPKQLVISAQSELDCYLLANKQEYPRFASEEDGLSILFKLPRLLKNAWHKSLKTFN